MIAATSGELASGLHGEGRMAEPEDIVEFITHHLSQDLPLHGKKVLITAGPTYEAIDPVRFVGNHSTGLMGFELAETAANLGATVVLVSGPSHLEVVNKQIELKRVVSADEMYEASHEVFDDVDVAICAAAVADYRQNTVADQKIKKSDSELSISLTKNKDILFSLGEKKQQQFLVGFALETENEVENAKGKLLAPNTATGPSA